MNHWVLTPFLRSSAPPGASGRPSAADRGAAEGRRHGPASGFSLIEVVITVGILMTLTVAVASMLRAGFDIKQGLSDRAKVVHRLALSMGKMADDIQHAFFVSQKDSQHNGIDRNMKTTFKLEKNGSSGDKLSLTTMTHRSNKSGAYESDFTFVVYELRDSKDAPGRRDLYRAETPVVPLDLKDEVPMRLLARNIKSLTVEPWNGEAWSKDRWAIDSGDTRNLLPRMVKITIEAWVRDRTDADGSDESLDLATDKLSTVVYLARAGDYKELKEGTKTVKWDNM